MTDVYAAALVCPDFPSYSMPILAFDTREAAVDFIECRLHAVMTDSAVPQIWERGSRRFRVQYIPGDESEDER